ncbi:Z1 domain-containing protein [Microbulbifer aggregans]|uniref:Z1 domain-containing protein n=1 Tax=Microbulbifer aggregans TaxID=1769779 RepID=UPI001CFD5111|nr:Z1 domain-containing protein [Microbulbifer aggregans]
MESNKYVALIKNAIAGQAEQNKKDSKSLDFFDDLYSNISENIKQIIKLFHYPEVDDATLKVYFEVAKREYLSVNPVDIEPSSALSKNNKESWLTETRAELIKWNYMDRYLQYLEKKGRAEPVITETETSSLDIMGRLGDPESADEFYVKGLVVGEVQSGKTGNFNGVINRSIDCGYKLIIVLSGIMEDLRSQTQQRIESDVIGEGVTDIDNDSVGKKGVGNICRFGHLGSSAIEQVVSITSHKSDFKKALADAHFSLNRINILVCKKNISVLRNLIVWLHDNLDPGKNQHSIPMLILDDEADNASLNNEGYKGIEYASKINGYIRTLLNLFSRKTYLGYTATPFANVLQDRNEAHLDGIEIKYKDGGVEKEKTLTQVDNIFPDDFIVLLNSPSNYIGAKQIFETITPINNEIGEKIPLVIPVEDAIENFPSRVLDNGDGDLVGVENFPNREAWNEVVGPYGSYLDFSTYQEYRKETRSCKKEDDFPKQLPTSLKEAIVCFILSTAVRESRKKLLITSNLFQPHNTMLIHVSRFTSWQNKTKKLIAEYVRDLENRIDNDPATGESSIYSEFEKIWYRYYAFIIESIKSYLPYDYVDEFLIPLSFNSLKPYLSGLIPKFDIKAINSVTGDKLVYPENKPKYVIAVGGNRLSRGFTLEGLTINYFVRSTNYSDTLLQMGRWFGYRPGFIDCCKLFTTYDSIEKFNNTTRCIEELETEFRKMGKNKKSPENFVLRVKKHPGVLKITRPSILYNTVEVKWSYQDQLEMTTQFPVDKESIESTWKTFKDLYVPKLNAGRVSDDFILYKSSPSEIIELLQKPNNFESSAAKAMIQFIRLCDEKKLLQDWTIALRTKGLANTKLGKGIVSASESGLNLDVGMAIRRGPSDKAPIAAKKKFLDSNVFMATGKSANILSSNKDMSLLLTDDQIKQAEDEFKSEKIIEIKSKYPGIADADAQKKVTKTFPERIYREKMGSHEGLLVIYLFDSYYSFNQEKGKEVGEFSKYVKENDIDLNIPLVGMAMGFPPIQDDPGGIYVQGDYNLELDEQIQEDLSLEDTCLPVEE